MSQLSDFAVGQKRKPKQAKFKFGSSCNFNRRHYEAFKVRLCCVVLCCAVLCRAFFEKHTNTHAHIVQRLLSAADFYRGLQYGDGEATKQTICLLAKRLNHLIGSDRIGSDQMWSNNLKTGSRHRTRALLTTPRPMRCGSSAISAEFKCLPSGLKSQFSSRTCANDHEESASSSPV